VVTVTVGSCGSLGDLRLNTIIANVFKCAVESSWQTNQEPINRRPYSHEFRCFLVFHGYRWYFMNLVAGDLNQLSCLCFFGHLASK